MITKETKAYVRGEYGKPPAEISNEIRQLIIGDEEPITCRPADLIKPALEDTARPSGDICSRKKMFYPMPCSRRLQKTILNYVKLKI